MATIKNLLAAALAWPSLVALCLASPAIDYSSLRCPSSNDTTLPTPTYGQKDAVFTICDERIINAPAQSVYNAILDFKSYPDWNSFVVDVDVPSSVTKTPEDVETNMKMTFTTVGLIARLDTTSNEVVSVMQGHSSKQDYLMAAWKYDDGAGGLLVTAEHPNILIPISKGVTRYLSYETYYVGGATSELLTLKSKLDSQFAAQGKGLKSYVESK